MTAHLRRQGHRVAACTVDRLMRDEGLSGVVRGGKHRTTIPADRARRRAPDLLDRDFTAAAPNRKWVTDFTYWPDLVRGSSTSRWWIDCFSRAIVGWHATRVKNTAMVTTALKMALWRRDHHDHRAMWVDSSQRRRIAIYVDCVRRNPRPGGDRSVDR